MRYRRGGLRYTSVELPGEEGLLIFWQYNLIIIIFIVFEESFWCTIKMEDN
jgi:hypothetical protein